tara:strand:+ start:957 stop:1814 length:858 start_codon:yes stop_codon:yes gene_type:complete
MSIKYLLNGQLSSDIYQLRNIIDFWSGNRKFPDIIDNIKNINQNDLILTSGLLGNTKKLIKKHNPNKIFILENAIFQNKGISNFRVLDGNLNSLLQNSNKSFDEENFYEKIFYEILNKFPYKLVERSINEKKIFIEFPWDRNIYNLVKNTRTNYLNEYEDKLPIIKKDRKTKLINAHIEEKDLVMYNKDYPIKNIKKLIRNNLKLKELINISEILICPTNELCYLGIINKKEVLISKYNPYYKWFLKNKNYKDKEIKKNIESLARFTSKLNFNINDIFNYIEETI